MGDTRSSVSSTKLQVFYLLLLIILGAPAFVIAKSLFLDDGIASAATDFTTRMLIYGPPLLAAGAAMVAFLLLQRFFDHLQRLTDAITQRSLHEVEEKSLSVSSGAECESLAAALRLQRSQSVSNAIRLSELQEQLQAVRTSCGSIFRTHAEHTRKILDRSIELLPWVGPGSSSAPRALDELRQAVDDALQRAHSTGEKIERFRELSTKSHGATESAHRQLLVLRHKSSTLSTAIQELLDRSQTVGQIAASVKLLASEIDHVALNATIEAARAGDVGRGFSIVAAEVRSLAEQSKGSAQQMRQVLEEIQKSSRTTLASAMDSEHNVDVLVEATRQTESLLFGLKSEADEAAESCTQILSVVSAQTKSLLHVKESVNQLQHGGEELMKLTTQKEEIRRLLESAESLLHNALTSKEPDRSQGAHR